MKTRPHLATVVLLAAALHSFTVLPNVVFFNVLFVIVPLANTLPHMYSSSAKAVMEMSGLKCDSRQGCH